MRYLIIILLLCVIVSAQDVKISEFGGLNTNTSVMKLKQGNYCLNLNIKDGTLCKRKGYLTLLPTGDTIAGNAPTIGIFGFRRSDGVRRMVGIASQPGDTSGASIDSTGLGFFLASPGLPAIPPGSGSMYYLQEQTSRRYYNYVYQGVTPFWTFWHDNVYMTNGRQRPLVFHPYNEMGHDGYARELVPLTPGEPLIVPMEGTGNLNGEYYYMIGHVTTCGTGYGANELGNSDFETWEADTLDLWDTLSYATGNILAETDSVKNGTYSVKFISDKGAGLFGYHAVSIGEWIEVNDDSLYQVDGWVNKLTDDGNITIQASDEDGNIINSISVYDETNGFVSVSFNFQPATGDDSAKILIYSFGACDECDTAYVDSVTVKQARANRFAVITKPVMAKNENVMLTNFPWQTIADTCSFDDAGYNALDLYIYRTKANPGDIDGSDNFYKITSISLSDTSQVDTLHFIDTIPDDTLGYSGFNTIINIDTLALGRDSSLVTTGIRVGAPTYVDNDSIHYWDGGIKFDDTTDCTGACDSLDVDTGLYRGVNIFITPIQDTSFISSVSYIMTYYDTLINAESDSSRSLHIGKNANDLMYEIGLPPVPGGKSHLTRKLYKSYTNILARFADSIATIHDTTISVWRGSLVGKSEQWINKYWAEPGRFIQDVIDNGRDIYLNPQLGDVADYNTFIKYRLKYYDFVADSTDTIYDTTATAYKLIAEIKGSDSVFIDTIGWDSTQKGKHYFKSEAPYNLNNITSFNDILFGSVGSELKWSYLDTGSVWGSFNALLLGGDEGDEITAILPMRDYIIVMLNTFKFIVYPGSVFEFERQETMQNLGCIAPHSALSYQDGLFYLSDIGVIHETGSLYRNRGSSIENISEPIDNILLNRTRDALRKAYGVVHKEKYWLSFADIDTTFVYNLKTGAWSIYSYVFAQATFYDTLTINSKNRTPSGDMVFITGSSDQLYKADTTNYDGRWIADTGGTVINTHYRTAPVMISADNYVIDKWGIWRESNDGSGGLDVRLYDMEGDSISYKYVDSIARKYDVYGVNSDMSHYFQIDIQDTTLDSLAIDQIDIWVTPGIEEPEK